MHIKTERLIITEFDQSMVESVHLNSLDEDNRRFVPDEVFESIEEAKETVDFLISCYQDTSGPLVYPILLHDGKHIGHIQAVQIDTGWEIGYHIAKAHTCKGYSTEAVTSFVPVIMKKLDIGYIHGVCLSDNIASVRVLEKSGFILEFEGTDRYQGKTHKISRYKYII